MATVGEQVQIYIQANSEAYMKQIGEAFKQLTETMQKLLPYALRYNEAHRAEVKRVHTAYRRRQKARKGRKS